MSRSKLTYASAIAKLEEIVQEIESGETDVDTLTEQVKKASELIAFCKNRLRTTQREVEETLMHMEKEDEKEDNAS
jgi:exodeoxyribonuclease VII small subunit